MGDVGTKDGKEPTVFGSVRVRVSVSLCTYRYFLLQCGPKSKPLLVRRQIVLKRVNKASICQI